MNFTRDAFLNEINLMNITSIFATFVTRIKHRFFRSNGGKPRFSRLGNLPPDVQSAIASRGNRDESSAPTGALLGVDLSPNHPAVDPGLRKTESELEGQAALHRYIHNEIYPKKGLPDVTATDENDTRPIAGDYVGIASRCWGYLLPEVKSGVIRDVLRIPHPCERVGCIRSFSFECGKLEPMHGRTLLQEAIEVLGKSPHDDSTSLEFQRSYACEAILNLEEHIGPEEKLRLEKVLGNPLCQAAFMSTYSRYQHPDAALSHRPHRDASLAGADEPPTLAQLRLEIDACMGDAPITERGIFFGIQSILSRLPDATDGILAEGKGEPVKHSTRVAEAIDGPASQARAVLSETQRARSYPAR